MTTIALAAIRLSAKMVPARRWSRTSSLPTTPSTPHSGQASRAARVSLCASCLSLTPTSASLRASSSPTRGFVARGCPSGHCQILWSACVHLRLQARRSTARCSWRRCFTRRTCASSWRSHATERSLGAGGDTLEIGFSGAPLLRASACSNHLRTSTWSVPLSSFSIQRTRATSPPTTCTACARSSASRCPSATSRTCSPSWRPRMPWRPPKCVAGSAPSPSTSSRR
mmetsp:Transcript_72351/g.143643  ORF Transcript_72351/g.143643 Transcript_72351/m.143643 type:complete len:227 (+) Transcript_72351:52-732(+)